MWLYISRSKAFAFMSHLIFLCEFKTHDILNNLNSIAIFSFLSSYTAKRRSEDIPKISYRLKISSEHVLNMHTGYFYLYIKIKTRRSEICGIRGSGNTGDIWIINFVAALLNEIVFSLPPKPTRARKRVSLVAKIIIRCRQRCWSVIRNTTTMMIYRGMSSVSMVFIIIKPAH